MFDQRLSDQIGGVNADRFARRSAACSRSIPGDCDARSKPQHDGSSRPGVANTSGLVVDTGR